MISPRNVYWFIMMVNMSILLCLTTLLGGCGKGPKIKVAVQPVQVEHNIKLDGIINFCNNTNNNPSKCIEDLTAFFGGTK